MTQSPIAETDIECIVAAILTAAAYGTVGMCPAEVIKRYAKLLNHPRDAGGYLNPASQP